MNIARLLEHQRDERPEAPALIAGRGAQRRVLSFRALHKQAAQTAALFRAHGLSPGDTVLLLQPMSIPLYVAVIGLLRGGLVAMVPDASANRARLVDHCRRHPPAALLGPPKAHLIRLLSADVRRIPTAFVTGRWPVPGAVRWERERDRHPPADSLPLDDDAPALLTFTSGSTGTPKPLVRTHGHLHAQYTALCDGLSLRPGQVDLATLPIFVLANLARGVTTVLPDADLRQPAAVDTGPLLEHIRTEQPTRTGGSPALYERLLDADADALSGFRRIGTGGAPLFPDMLQRLDHAAPAADVLAVYGATEAEPIAHVSTDAIADADWNAMRNGAGLLAGPPVEAIDLRILPDRWGTPHGPFSKAAFDAQCCAPGTPGEIVVRGPHVVAGADDDAVIDVAGTRWHRTGDAGRLDADGRLWLLGRCHARVDDDRGTTYPFAVECAAQSLDSVARAAYVAHRGDRVLAVEPADGAPAPSRDVLQAHVSAPVDARVVLPTIPVDRRHNAKIDYPALHEHLDRRR